MADRQTGDALERPVARQHRATFRGDESCHGRDIPTSDTFVHLNCQLQPLYLGKSRKVQTQPNEVANETAYKSRVVFATANDTKSASLG